MDRAVTDTSDVPDTSAVGDTSDTSGVQNPPGYRGMERDTTIFPAEGAPPAGHDTTHQSGAGVGDTTAQTPDSVQ